MINMISSIIPAGLDPGGSGEGDATVGGSVLGDVVSGGSVGGSVGEAVTVILYCFRE